MRRTTGNDWQGGCGGSPYSSPWLRPHASVHAGNKGNKNELHHLRAMEASPWSTEAGGGDNEVTVVGGGGMYHRAHHSTGRHLTKGSREQG